MLCLYASQGYFGLFLVSKIRILKNYENGGSRHEGAEESLKR